MTNSALLAPPVVDAHAHCRVTEQLRRQIHDNVFAVGGKIPTVRALARQFDISVQTVHRAVSPLVAEGLLERRHGSGMYVRRTRAAVNCFAVYVGETLERTPAKLYRWTLYDELKTLLSQKGIKTRLWVDDENRPDASDMPPELEGWIRGREVQGLVVLSRADSALAWIRRLALPWAMFTVNADDRRVGPDAEQESRLVAEVLARRGCRRPAVISSRFRTPGNPSIIRYYEHLAEAFQANDIPLAPENILQPATKEEVESEAAEYGYSMFKRLWAMPERPDGIFVNSDVAARGVALAMAECGARPPEALQAVFHRNRGVELFAPFPYIAVEMDPRACAEAATVSLEYQLSGQPAKPVLVPYTLIEPPNS